MSTIKNSNFYFIFYTHTHNKLKQYTQKKKKKTWENYFDILLKKILRRLSNVVGKLHCGQIFFLIQHSSQLICQQFIETHGLIHDSY